MFRLWRVIGILIQSPGSEKEITVNIIRASTRVSAGLLALALPAIFTGQQAADISAEAPTDFRISVDLNLVDLAVTVSDHKGGFISGLNQPDFDVYEDGVKQSIRLFRHDDIPVTVGLVIDHSGSMHNKIGDVITAARTFARVSNPEDQMTIVNFNERVTLGLPEGTNFSNKVDELGYAIMRGPVAGQTALYDATNLALDRLQLGNRDKKVLIIVSDGGDNASKLDLASVLKKAEQSSAIIYAVGILDPNDPDQNPGVLRKLAKETGGEAFFPEAAAETVKICERIAADIRAQYTLGYVSANSTQSGYRAIRVAAHSGGKKYDVRARAGYLAGGAK